MVILNDAFEQLLGGVILAAIQDGRHGVTFEITRTHSILFAQSGAYFVNISLVSVIFISSLDFYKVILQPTVSLLQVRGDRKRNILWDGRPAQHV